MISGKTEERLLKAIEDQAPDCIALSDDLAAHPEVSGCEVRSSQVICELLADKGWDAEKPFADLQTAFRAVCGPQGHSHKVALLTEYDALPGLGHACGHCVSGSISVLAGLALAPLQDELDTDIHIIGTPAEETDGAKAAMADKGIFDIYDMAEMVHMNDCSMVTANIQALRAWLFKFHGKASHAAAAPWEGRNALNGVHLMCVASDMLRQHILPECRMHSVVRNGGKAPNIVPEEASVEFFIRATHPDVIEDLQRKLFDCARGAAIATQTKADWERTDPPYDCLVHNAAGEQSLRGIYDDLGIERNGDEHFDFGSTDCGNVSSRCPTFHALLQLVPQGTPLHTKAVAEAVTTEKGHEALLQGARILGLQVVRIFSDPDKIAAMKADFERETGRQS